MERRSGSTVKAKFQSGPYHAVSKVVNETLRRNFTSADSGLGDWAAEQLARLAADADEIPSTIYSAEWKAAFGSIGDPSFAAPELDLPFALEPLNAGL